MIILRHNITALLLLFFLCFVAGPGEAPASSGQKEDEDEEITKILDEESEAGEEEGKGDEPKEKEKKEKAPPSEKALFKTDRFSTKLLAEEESIDWDASFQKEFEREEDEVITPSKKYEDLFYAIPAVSLIKRQDIFELNAIQLSSAAEKAPGIHMVHMQDSSPSPVMRGLYGNRVQLLFDGIRLSNTYTPSGMDYLSGLVDVLSLDSIELVGGPSTIQYGTGAMGGVINFIPQSPKINPFVAKSTNAKAFLRYSTLDASISAHADTTLHTFDSGLHAGVSFEDHGSLTSGKEKQSFTGYDRASVNFIAAKHFFPSHELKLGYFFTRVMGADRQIPGTEDNDYMNWPFHERHLVYMQYSGNDISSLEQVQFTTGVHLQNEKLNRHLLYRLEDPRTDKDRLTAGSVFGLFHLSANLGGWGGLMYGMDYYFDRIGIKSYITESISSETTITSPAERSIFENGAMASSFEHYALMELYFLRPVLISAGGRAVWSYIDTGEDETSHRGGGGAQLEIRIPIVGRLKSTKFVTLSDVLALNLIANYASRPPTLDELSVMRTVPEGIVFGDPDLENEQMVGAQGGLKWNAGLIEGLLYYSYSHFESFIQVGSDSPSYELCPFHMCWVYGNGGKADLHSLEFINEFNIKNFLNIGLLLNYTYGVEENFLGNKEPMSYIPPLNLAVWLKARYHKYGLWGEIRLKWAWNQENLSLRDLGDRAICGPVPGCSGTDWYLLLAFRGGVRITNRFFLSFSFNNLMNSLYKTHGSILYGPGIGASVSIEARL